MSKKKEVIFCLSSDLFSHIKFTINIIKKNGEYKEINEIIYEVKLKLINYILSLDFSNKELLEKEFKEKDLWILSKILKENNELINATFLINNIYEKHFEIHDYTIDDIIKDRCKEFYICNHEHN